MGKNCFFELGPLDPDSLHIKIQISRWKARESKLDALNNVSYIKQYRT